MVLRLVFFCLDNGVHDPNGCLFGVCEGILRDYRCLLSTENGSR
jgi:hypothetical protein